MKASVCLRYGLQPRAKPRAKPPAKSLSILLIVAHCKTTRNGICSPLRSIRISPQRSGAGSWLWDGPQVAVSSVHQRLNRPNSLCLRPLDYRDPTSAASSPPTLDVAANSCSPFAPYLNPFVSVAFSVSHFSFPTTENPNHSSLQLPASPSTPSSVSCSPPATEFCSATPPNNNHPAKVTLSQRSRLDLDHSSRQDVFQSPQLVCALSLILWLLDAQRPPNHRNTQC